MLIEVMKSKIHCARVTEANLNYMGSITIDEDLMDTNQQFFLMPNEALKKLENQYAFAHFGAADKNRTIVRICTSWATRQEDAEQLVADIKRIGGK